MTRSKLEWIRPEEAYASLDKKIKLVYLSAIPYLYDFFDILLIGTSVSDFPHFNNEIPCFARCSNSLHIIRETNNTYYRTGDFDDGQNHAIWFTSFYIESSCIILLLSWCL